MVEYKLHSLYYWYSYILTLFDVELPVSYATWTSQPKKVS